MKSKFLSFLLALVMILSTVPMYTFTAEAAATSFPKLSDVTMSKLKVKVGNTTLPLNNYPSGSYFTKNGQPCKNHVNGRHCSNCKPAYGGWECLGFARYVYAQCFGEKCIGSNNNLKLGSTCASSTGKYFYNVIAKTPDITKTYEKSVDGYYIKCADLRAASVEKVIKNAQPGALIRLQSATDVNWGHSIVLLLVCNDGFYGYDANIEDDCGVRVAKYTWQEFVDFAKEKSWVLNTVHMPYDYPGWQVINGVSSGSTASYTVTYNVNGGNEYSCPSKQTKAAGKTLTLTTAKPTRDGAKFLGWSTKEWPTGVEYASGASYSKDADVKLHAVWEFSPGTYKVDGSYGTIYFREKADPNSTLLGRVSEGTQFDITKFNGNWGYVQYDGNWGYVSMRYMAFVKAVQVKQYVFTFNGNFGIGSMTPQTVTQGETFVVATNEFTRNGYTFAGWAVRRDADNTWATVGKGWLTENQLAAKGIEKQVLNQAKPMRFDDTWTAGYSGGDVTYTFFALWKSENPQMGAGGEAKTYSLITYHPNGGRSYAVSGPIDLGASYVLSDWDPLREGYTLQGWAKTSDAVSAEYHAGDVLIPAGDITIFAIWKANTYTVHYDANGGNNAPDDQTKTYDVNLTLSDLIPTRSGYEFRGWSRYQTSTTAEYTAGGTFSSNADTTLYAVWGRPAAKENGLTLKNGTWYYYVNGVVDTSYTGLAYREDIGWWYVENGRINFDYTGLAYREDIGWWYVENSQITFGYTGLTYTPEYGWWYVTNSQLLWDYTGLAYREDIGWWYVENSQITFGYTGLTYTPEYGWWYVTNSQLLWDYTGLAYREDIGWWYVENSGITFSYTGLTYTPEYGWWYVTNSQLLWDYTGLAYREDIGWWYVESSNITFCYNGVVAFDGKTYTIVNSQVIG